MVKKSVEVSVELENDSTLARALELLDNCAIAIERDDENFMLQAGGAAREFLDTITDEEQALFRNWHNPGADYGKSKIG